MKPPSFRPSRSATTLILIPLALLASIYLFLYPREFELQSLVTTCGRSTLANFTGPVTVKPDFRLLMGILTRADLYERRHLLRLVYSLQTNLTAHIDIRFVFCNLTKEDQRVLIPLEIMRYDDIIILNCTENMNSGKTYTYLSSLPELFNGTNGDGRPYDYVLKADDDIYFRLPSLIESLKKMPREDLYYGFVIPCGSMDPFHDYMSGMGYILSWDLVEWISTSEMVRNESSGVEDFLTGKWLTDGKRGKNRFNTKPAMYDYPIPVPIDTCSHAFVPDTIAVHRLKDHLKWARTLKYFNVTDGLKPSKFYHID
ncbi:beta-1,3-galactosyltransferase pvg3-like [Phoenix dactylifera]|uniref:Hexosyltransferase n=1 Tax=Phoenix dactylifera TaxID=42345 RepID=A0A8B7D1J0_PHODC|nr:beta-1,3-galactosyltransferase pvg3-like [Phoenix dactylifera]